MYLEWTLCAFGVHSRVYLESILGVSGVHPWYIYCVFGTRLGPGVLCMYLMCIGVYSACLWGVFRVILVCSWCVCGAYLSVLGCIGVVF